MSPDSLLSPAQALLRKRGGGESGRFWEPGHPGLNPGLLHEFQAREAGDAAAAAGLVAGLAIAAADGQQPCQHRGAVWLRARRGGGSEGLGGAVIQGAGWAELGGAPECCLFVLAEDTRALLRAGLDTVRSGARVVVIEGRGSLPELDLTASRRLALAAAKAGVLLMVLRSEGEGGPSAAWTRWAVASAPSRALAANAPGLPSFDIELLRHRAGPAGGRWRLEWDRDRREFRDALSGAVAAVPAGGAVAAGSGRGRRAA